MTRATLTLSHLYRVNTTLSGSICEPARNAPIQQAAGTFYRPKCETGVLQKTSYSVAHPPSLGLNEFSRLIQ